MFKQSVLRASSKRLLLSLRCQHNGNRDINNSSVNNPAKVKQPFKLPEEPTNCCMSGCANCVWIQYAKDLADIIEGGGEEAKAIVMQKISDPSLKMFLRLELENIKQDDINKNET